MKKLFLLFITASLGISSFAQEKKIVQFAESVYDFGVIAEGGGNYGTFTAIFKFTNVGNSPIFIENARASCGCTTPRIDLGKPIAPGDSGEIPVAYNTNGRPGSFNKDVTITFKNAAGETSVDRIVIKGRVTPKSAQNIAKEENMPKKTDAQKDNSQKGNHNKSSEQKSNKKGKKSKVIPT